MRTTAGSTNVRCVHSYNMPMELPEFVSTVVALPSIVGKATSAGEAWADLRSQVGERWNSASEVLHSNLDHEVELIVAQLQKIFAEEPLQSNLKLLYFGLFTATNPDTSEQIAGYYVSGTTLSVPFVQAGAEVAAGVLDYWPKSKYLWSPILQRVRKAALANESLYDEYDYAAMLCTASILSFFAVRRLELRCRVVVGFDSGDALELPEPTRSE